MSIQTRGLRRIRANLRDNADSPAAIAAAIAGVQSSFVDFRTRNDARFRQVETHLDEVNRRVQLVGLSPSGHQPAGGRRLSAETREAIVSVLQGQSPSLPRAVHKIGDDPSGGYGVVPELDSLIDPTVRRQNALRRLARVVTLPMGVGSYVKLLPTRGSGVSWATEVSTRSATTEATFGRIEIGPVECYAYVPVSQWLLDDNGVGLEEWLGNDVASAIFEGEGDAFINGNGSTQPRGLVTYSTSSELDDSVRPFGTIKYVPTGVSGSLTAGASPESNPADVLIDLTLAIVAGYRAGATWLMNSNTAGVVRKIKDNDGRYIWTDSLVAGQPAMLLGYPVEIDESMPAIAADSLSIAFGDFRRAYIVVDRPGIRLVSDPYTTPGLVNSYWFKRVGGGIGDSRAVAFLKFGTS